MEIWKGFANGVLVKLVAIKKELGNLHRNIV
jgi:hypothetical protein